MAPSEVVTTVLGWGAQRILDSDDGGKGRKLSQPSNLDPLALSMLFTVAGLGAREYEPRGFMNGNDWSKYFDAGMRHAIAFQAGEDVDQGSGMPHAVHAAWNFLVLAGYFVRGVGNDDRFVQEDHVQPVLPMEKWATEMKSAASGRNKYEPSGYLHCSSGNDRVGIWPSTVPNHPEVEACE